MPSAPVPQNRSRTLAPPSSPRIEKTASRTRSAVGRTAAARRRGVARWRPLRSPATTRITSRRDRLGPLVAEAPAGRVQQRPELGRLERTVALDEGDHLAPGLREDADILGKLRDRKARQAVLARTEDLSLAAQGEIDLRELEAVTL